LSVARGGEVLLDLAKSRQPADRERLLLAIADLCDSPEAGDAMRSAPIQALLSSIFMSLVVEAEREIRRRLSEKLATADWAPNALINVLALDDIEIAQPIIAGSPVLRELDLVRLLVEATIEHQIEVARRPHLPATVVGAILEKAEPAVLTALAGNTTAELSPDDMAELVEASRQISEMHTPLSEHPRLTGQLAKRLYLWVGLALRQGLSDRFRLDVGILDEALAASVNEAHGPAAKARIALAAAPPRTSRYGEREDMERRLLEKLHAAGQLRPGYLIRALREERLALFTGGMALMGGFEETQITATLDSDRPELLALACAAVGIDRSVFPDLLDMVRALNSGLPGGGAEGARKAIVAFAPVAPDIAAAAFRQAVRTLKAA
jgi:uncharacterized protein (DUF2336 family)